MNFDLSPVSSIFTIDPSDVFKIKSAFNDQNVKGHFRFQRIVKDVLLYFNWKKYKDFAQNSDQLASMLTEFAMNNELDNQIVIVCFRVAIKIHSVACARNFLYRKFHWSDKIFASLKLNLELFDLFMRDEMKMSYKERDRELWKFYFFLPYRSRVEVLLMMADLYLQNSVNFLKNGDNRMAKHVLHECHLPMCLAHSYILTIDHCEYSSKDSYEKLHSQIKEQMYLCEAATIFDLAFAMHNELLGDRNELLLLAPLLEIGDLYRYSIIMCRGMDSVVEIRACAQLGLFYYFLLLFKEKAMGLFLDVIGLVNSKKRDEKKELENEKWYKLVVECLEQLRSEAIEPDRSNSTGVRGFLSRNIDKLNKLSKGNLFKMLRFIYDKFPPMSRNNRTKVFRLLKQKKFKEALKTALIDFHSDKNQAQNCGMQNKEILDEVAKIISARFNEAKQGPVNYEDVDDESEDEHNNQQKNAANDLGKKRWGFWKKKKSADEKQQKENPDNGDTSDEEDDETQQEPFSFHGYFERKYRENREKFARKKNRSRTATNQVVTLTRKMTNRKVICSRDDHHGQNGYKHREKYYGSDSDDDQKTDDKYEEEFWEKAYRRRDGEHDGQHQSSTSENVQPNLITTVSCTFWPHIVDLLSSGIPK